MGKNSKDKKNIGKNREGEDIYVYKAKYGPVIQIKDKYWPIPKNIQESQITKEQCIQISELPRLVGRYKNIDIKLCCSSLGFYIDYDTKKISILDKEFKANNLDITYYHNLIKQNDKKTLRNFNNSIKIMDGPYGPYILEIKKNKKKNSITKLPKNLSKNIEKITLQEINEILLKKK